MNIVTYKSVHVWPFDGFQNVLTDGLIYGTPCLVSSARMLSTLVDFPSFSGRTSSLASSLSITIGASPIYMSCCNSLLRMFVGLFGLRS